MLAREYGFAGWQELRAAVLRLEGKGLEWAAAEAERAIHANNVERLAQLIQEYPALLSWRGDSGESLLGFATGSFGDSGDPYREQMFTRLECAEFLLDAGANAQPGDMGRRHSRPRQGSIAASLAQGCSAAHARCSRGTG